MGKEETLFQLTVLNPWFWVFIGIIGVIFYTATIPDKSHDHPDDEEHPRRSTSERELEFEKELKRLEELEDKNNEPTVHNPGTESVD